MSFDRDEFCEYRALDSMMTVTVANGQQLQVRGVGSVRFSIGGSQMVKLTDVLFVPQLDRKLLSIAALVAKGAEVLFQNRHCDIRLGEDWSRACTRKESSSHGLHSVCLGRRSCQGGCCSIDWVRGRTAVARSAWTHRCVAYAKRGACSGRSAGGER